MHTIYITWEEAQELKRVLKELKRTAPWKEARESAGRVYEEVRNVRKTDYSPLPGYQLILAEGDMGFLKSIMKVYGI